MLFSLNKKKSSGAPAAPMLDHQSAPSHQEAFQAAQQARLPWLMSQDHIKRVLSTSTSSFCPTRQSRISSWTSWPTAVTLGAPLRFWRALNGLFTLITKHNLCVLRLLVRERNRDHEHRFAENIPISPDNFTRCCTDRCYMCASELVSCACSTSSCLLRKPPQLVCKAVS